MTKCRRRRRTATEIGWGRRRFVCGSCSRSMKTRLSRRGNVPRWRSETRWCGARCRRSSRSSRTPKETSWSEREPRTAGTIQAPSPTTRSRGRCACGGGRIASAAFTTGRPSCRRASLLERTAPALGYAVACGYGSAPSRQLERDLLASARCPPSRATLERMGKALGTQIGADLLLYEPLVRARERLSQDFCAITVGLDRTTVPMDEPCDASCTHEKTGTRE